MNTIIKGARDNGINVSALREFTEQVKAKPAAGVATFDVLTTWEGGTRTRARAMPIVLGDKVLTRDFVIDADEPAELLGTDTAANPQELILAALNACMAATYVANAAVLNIALRSLTIRTKGSLDLRGFLGIDPGINPGYDQIEYEVEIDSPSHPAALEALHAQVQRTSPNYHNFARAIVLKAKLTILP
ncbi:OsmC family protein [Paraburkholderia fungorum]|uniref:OsmC family protein n=1 Tax=Paraburkholderia fungorum TaxID=134537 RepID=UPI00402B17C9